MSLSPGILHDLFESRALRVSPAEQPFWYTSGLFGPYYINTHFLFGSETAAKNLLSLIENTASTARESFCETIAAACREQAEASPLYRRVLDRLETRVRERAWTERIISGGERRDFFFSIPLAERLGRVHLSLFKDGEVYLNEMTRAAGEMIWGAGRRLQGPALQGASCLHVADLITEASSYARAWKPFIEAHDGRLEHTLALVDRHQGGRERLAGMGVETSTLLTLSPAFFAEAREEGLITPEQETAILAYAKDPMDYVRRFLERRPDFLEREAARDARTAERVARLRSLIEARRSASGL